ncbi:M14 metallopeptidase family protein [Ulvibacter litoralis]|uniref:Uncharacterized membrane protein n=1 Tax=Ulvibacter litoralis TaxID=227084 RepID=A0A1G7ITF6_9FLAO|nr:M14 metallopeptidase family protein [Ulvibacter litoralis]GHC63214.1 peptidase M14 [Ulvibacter litoralis]SDF15878.1 Uncharacterized membrane protein [Ulvibacter litoralis]
MTRYFTIVLLFLITSLHAQLQSPAEFLGYEIGTQFTRHSEVVRYFEHVAANSDLVNYTSYGKTNERRPLTYAVISSPQNIKNIETIRHDNLKSIGIESGAANPKIAITWLSYNVHGNEASSTEAAMATLYTLITEKQDWLQNTVIVMDPCVNPDGRDRYVNWYNQVKSTPYNLAQAATEHNEPWPGGRPNHYLFDLNRDWAWATQVESEQRLKVYNQWMPHIHVDFHEQGINDPYYFAPAAKPFHEIITPFQRDFQTEIGKNHAKYFDKEGWLFFTRESFDLLYPSYGDTYPIFMGAIGMTYEQAGHGRAGLGINTDEGYDLTLVDRVAHHTTTGISTIEMASKNAARLATEFKSFFTNPNTKYKNFVLKGNPDKLKAVTKLLDKHEIKYGFATNGTVSGYHYSDVKSGSMNAKGALVVSTQQPKGKMVSVLFEPEAKLEDPLTYDITAWSLPYAYGLETIATTATVATTNNAPYENFTNTPLPSGAGYISKWDDISDASFLAELLQNDINVRFSEKELQFSGNTFGRGSLVITKSDNRTNNQFDQLVTSIANKHQRKLYATPTSFSDNGTDFGSQYIKSITAPSIAMLRGDAVSSLSFGATWHFFETQLKYPVTNIETDDLSDLDLSKFTILIFPEGWYSSLLNESTISKLKEWISNGGKIIATGNALSAFEGMEGFDLVENTSEEKEDEETEKTPNLTPYDQRERESVKDFITGSIYKVQIDASHPMAFGYGDTYFSLKQGGDSYAFLEDGYNVGYLKDDAISVSGFSGVDAKAGLKNSVVFGEARMGKGSIVYLVDDVLFRSFWENGKLFFANALFFVNNNKAGL